MGTSSIISPTEYYERKARNLADRWADGNSAAFKYILAALLEAAAPPAASADAVRAALEPLARIARLRDEDMDVPAADEQILFRLPAYQDVGITMGDCRKALAALSTAPVAGADAAMRERAVKVEEAAQAVIDRWESPAWKDRPATATYINNLRAALYSHDAPPQL